MDIFSTTVIVIHEIYTVSVFIRRVVHDIHGYEATVSSIQARLEHEFLFLDTFKQQFFDPNDGNLRKFKSLPDNLARNVNSILTGLNKCLVEYRVVALKHGVDLTEAAELLEPETNATSIISPSTAPVTNEDRARRFRDKVRALAATLRQKSLAPEWALFSMSKVETLVNEYPQWTKRLRQLMFLMLLIDGRVGSLSLHGLAVRDAGSALGLKKVAARQIRAKSNSPVDLGPLDGTLEIRELTGQSGNLEDQFAKRQVGVYTDAFGAVSVEVLLEKHLFDLFSADPNEDEKARIRSSIARDLVWTLRDGDPSAPEYSNGLLDKDLAGLLPCLGYLPADDDGYHSLAYRLPSGIAGKPLLTLHDHILGFPRPPLGDRFALAWRLTATVLDILSSGWVHKNIWSRGVLIMLSNDSCPTPYLLEVELYHHPERYHTKKAGYSPKHDLYSLGVLLLEIALWTTMSKQFEGPIAKVQSMKMLPPLNVVEGAMDKLSQDPRVAREMGAEYARIIRRCLKTDFDVDKHDEGWTALLGQFDALVVEQLSRSMSL